MIKSRCKIFQRHLAPNKTSAQFLHTQVWGVVKASIFNWLKTCFTLPLKPGQRWRPLPNYQKKKNSWLIPELRCTCWAKRSELIRTGNSQEIQNLYWSANKRGSTSVCSRSWPLRDCAITRRYACSTKAWEALRRTRISKWVGQRSATTVDQKGEEKILVIYKSRNRAKDEQAPGKWRPQKQKQNKKKDDIQDAEERLRDLPEWLEEFTDDPETQKRLCLHTFRRTQIRNVLRKWRQKIRRHTIFTHFPKDRNCEVCMRTKITKAPCRRRTGEAEPQAEKFCDLITAD